MEIDKGLLRVNSYSRNNHGGKDDVDAVLLGCTKTLIIDLKAAAGMAYRGSEGISFDLRAQY